MKTITKQWLVCGLIGLGLAGCQKANEDQVMTADDGTKQTGVTPSTAIKDSAGFAKKNQGAITPDAKDKDDYKSQTGTK